MKNTMTLIMLAMMSSPLLAENNSNNSSSNSLGANCITTIENAKKERKAANAEVTPLGSCEKFNVLAIMNGEPMADSDSSATIDGKIQCKKSGGYTMDYNDCSRVSGLYNGVIMAEQAMFATQKIILTESNIKQNKEIEAAKAKGDLQYGAIEAVIERNKLNKKMHDTQAITYSSAVGALSSGIIAWQKKGSLGKMCEKDFERIQKSVAKDLYYTNFTPVECKAIVEEYKKSSIVFQNNGAKARFLAEIGIFLQKAAEAKRLAGISADVGQRLKNAPSSKDVDTTVFDPCMTNANGVACKANGPRNIKGGTFAGSQNNFGTGTGTNQDFNFDPNGPAGLGGIDPLGNASNPEKVGDVSSPFEQAAKDASGILDPAGLANVNPGSQSSAPDGGGGGGGGGGSASLGDDLAGAKAEDNSDPDIKTTKVSGNYKAGGKSGFQAVKGGSSGDDANPFASMFDDKGEAGGIEEDRSIASDGGQDSGLFQKISKKYGQVQQDNRLDSQNLE
jgi:hypothetical protein